MFLSNLREYVYFKNSGWSSHLFLDHAKYILPRVKEFCGVVIGRLSIRLTDSNGKVVLRIFVHHNGRTNEFMTITDSKQKELATFHYTDSSEDMLDAIRTNFNARI